MAADGEKNHHFGPAAESTQIGRLIFHKKGRSTALDLFICGKGSSQKFVLPKYNVPPNSQPRPGFSLPVQYRDD